MGISKVTVEMLAMDHQPEKSRNLASAENLKSGSTLLGKYCKMETPLVRPRALRGKQSQPGCWQNRFPSLLQPCVLTGAVPWSSTSSLLRQVLPEAEVLASLLFCRALGKLAALWSLKKLQICFNFKSLNPPEWFSLHHNPTMQISVLACYWTMVCNGLEPTQCLEEP